MFLLQHNFFTDKKNRPLYLNYSKKTGDIVPLRNTQNNEFYRARFRFVEDLIPLLALIDLEEWEPVPEEELGSSSLFNLEHNYMKSKDGSPLYLNIDKKNGKYRAHKGKVDNKLYKAEFTKDEMKELGKKIPLDKFTPKGVI